jgi:putative ABC transport system permease protein
MLATLAQGIRGALRTIARDRAFSVPAIITIALAVGFSVGIFSLLNALLLRPLPYLDPSRLVVIGKSRASLSRPIGMSEPELLDLRERARSFSRLEFIRRVDFVVVEAEASSWVVGASASTGIFDLLGVHPVLGRTFRPGDEIPGQHLVAVIGERLWRARFAGDPRVIGRRIRLSPYAGRETQSHEIVGVLPESVQLDYSNGVEIVVPYLWQHLPRAGAARRSAGLTAIGRLRTESSFADALNEMGTLSEQLNREFPTGQSDQIVTVQPLHEYHFGNNRRASVMLAGAVALISLLCCVNVAILLKARVDRTRSSIAIQLALGCDRSTLLRRLFLEHIVLALIGAGAGYLLALWIVNTLVALAPASLSRIGQAGLDRNVFVFFLVMTAIVGCVLAALPARGASVIRAVESVKSSRVMASHPGGFALSGLIACECALVLVLVIGAGLLVQSVWRLANIRLGFDPKNVLAVHLLLPPRWSWESGQRLWFDEQVLARLRDLSAVALAAAGTDIPFGSGGMVGVSTEGSKSPALAFVTGADSQYFAVLGVSAVRGRLIQQTDGADTPRVAVVNRSFARKFFGDMDPIGRRFTLTDTHEVVGLVDDISELTDGGIIRRPGLILSTLPAAYVPIAQAQWTRQVYLVVKASANSAGVMEDIRRAIGSVDNQVAVRQVAALSEQVKLSTAETTFYATVLGLFSLVALCLGAVGIQGVVAQSVEARLREMGIRLAIGATPTAILVLVLKRVGLAVAVGCCVGLALVLPAVRVLDALLFGLESMHFPTFLSGLLVLVLVALLAAWMPARRAARADPVDTLRYN